MTKIVEHQSLKVDPTKVNLCKITPINIVAGTMLINRIRAQHNCAMEGETPQMVYTHDLINLGVMLDDCHRISQGQKPIKSADKFGPATTRLMSKECKDWAELSRFDPYVSVKIGLIGILENQLHTWSTICNHHKTVPVLNDKGVQKVDPKTRRPLTEYRKINREEICDLIREQIALSTAD